MASLATVTKVLLTGNPIENDDASSPLQIKGEGGWTRNQGTNRRFAAERSRGKDSAKRKKRACERCGLYFNSKKNHGEGKCDPKATEQ